MSTGLDGQFGYKTESVNGTAVVVDAFLPFVSEGIGKEIARIPSAGIRAGRRVQHVRRAGAETVGGTLEFELPNVDVAPLFKHMFGAVDTNGGGTYTYTPGDLNDDSFTLQVGKPGTAGTVHPFTYNGCKIASWEIACAAGELAVLTLDVSAWDETTGTALASASYDSGYQPFSFVEGNLTIAGTTNNTVRSISLTGANTLAVDRHRFGSATILEQLENGMREYGGSITADFEDLTAYNRFINKTQAALVLLFDNGDDSLTVTANVEFDGETPKVSGPELLEQPLPFVCVSTTSDAAGITAVLTNGDASSD